MKSIIERLNDKQLGDKLKPFDFESNQMIVFYKKDFEQEIKNYNDELIKEIDKNKVNGNTFSEKGFDRGLEFVKKLIKG